MQEEDEMTFIAFFKYFKIKQYYAFNFVKLPSKNII